MILALSHRACRQRCRRFVAPHDRGRPRVFLTIKGPSSKNFLSSTEPRNDTSFTNVETKKDHLRKKIKHGESERELFLSILNASTTRRDAKSYLSRFSRTGLGHSMSPFAQGLGRSLALVKIRAPQGLGTPTLSGVAETVSQLHRLGLSCVVVLDTSPDPELFPSAGAHAHRLRANLQADRFVELLERNNLARSVRLDNILAVELKDQTFPVAKSLQADVIVQYPALLSKSIDRGHIPVIPPIAIAETQQILQLVSADDVVVALTRQLAGHQLPPAKNSSENQNLPMSSRYLLDKIIIIDPLGPIPSATRLGQGHVFLNMAQEYNHVRSELIQQSVKRERSADSTLGPIDLSRSENAESQPLSNRARLREVKPSQEVIARHISTLDLLQTCLSLLPPSSSAILTSAHEAAASAQQSSIEMSLGVRTRHPKNPLIHNLLTDKPPVSSSLPQARMAELHGAEGLCGIAPVGVMLARQGMPLTMIPDPRLKIWSAPKPGSAGIALDDAGIDFARLLNLIEDSFNRTLDVEHYVRRTRDMIAGIIVAGEYEGGAILTWELPPGVPRDGSESSRRRMVPYLDKFAVLKRSQGAGGVADIIFSAMVSTCFPHGVCWRSRKDNPVNKWYFERAKGTWKLPKTEWTMFWTDPNLCADSQRWHDYKAVCRSVQPSWVIRS